MVCSCIRGLLLGMILVAAESHAHMSIEMEVGSAKRTSFIVTGY